MKKIITKEQAENLAGYLLKSTIPSIDAQNWVLMLKDLPVLPDVTPETKSTE